MTKEFDESLIKSPLKPNIIQKKNQIMFNIKPIYKYSFNTINLERTRNLQNKCKKDK